VRQESGRPENKCSHWLSEIRDLWRAVRKAVGWRRAKWKPIALLFREAKVTEAVLDFLTRALGRYGERKSGDEDEDDTENGISM
jgi:hypothetical protein